MGDKNGKDTIDMGDVVELFLNSVSIALKMMKVKAKWISQK